MELSSQLRHVLELFIYLSLPTSKLVLFKCMTDCKTDCKTNMIYGFLDAPKMTRLS